MASVLLNLALLLATSVVLAEEPTLPANDRLRLGMRTGIQAFDYHEKLGAIDSDYTSVGPAVGFSANLRVVDRLRFNLDYLGAFIQEDTETWDNLGTVAGLPITQQNALNVDFHALDIDLGYSIVRQKQVEWALVVGWHFYQENFTRSDFRFLVATIVIPVNIGPVSEDVTGRGIKLGTTLEFQATEKLSLQGGIAWYGLYDVVAENSLLGKVDSDGNAFRWRLAADYQLTKDLTLGGGYEGHFINVNEGRSAIAILPKNETRAHTFLVSLGIRF